jgi:protein involved in polysaccharide export with SLBB domain
MKKLLLLILLIPAVLFSQDISNLQNKKLNDLNDTELLNYWKEAQERGYSLDQIKLLARAQGVSELEINEFEKRIKSLDVNNEDNDEDLFDSSSLTTIFGKNTELDDINEQSLMIGGLPIFGSNFFNNKNISPAPQLNIATPASYELGPGDEILISIWGAAENEYTSEISREGFIKVERIGPVYVSGLTVSEAKNKLRRSLSKIYSGLNSSDSSNFKVFLDLSLINNRSIVINVTGNVVAPDTYTISSLSSVLNVLYAAGGPNESGTFRNIRIIRDGIQVKSIDLYDYFSSGKLETFSLRDQDVINVPNYENRVFVNGEFKTTGIFETKNDEKIIDLIEYTGGIASFGFKDKIFIKRINGLNRKIEDIDSKNFKNFKLRDGDIIEARPVTDTYTNLITVEGAVAVPGEYSISNAENINDVIEKAGGLLDYAIKERAYIIRKFNGIEDQIVSFSFSNAQNITPKAEDKIIISSKVDLTRTQTVSIEGEVSEPNNYPFFDGMTLIDLILVSKGLTLKGDLKNISIYRSTYDESRQNPVQTLKISLDSDFSKIDSVNNIKLEENDLVIVRERLGYQDKEFVTVEGLVKFPGTYAIKDNNYSVYDLVKDFGGFLQDASLDGVKIVRKNKLNDILNEEDDEGVGEEEEFSSKLSGISNKDSLNIKLEIKPFIEFGVDIKQILKTNGSDPKYNVVLKSYDKIIVPRKDNTIEITGAVQQSSAVTYSNSLTTISAINRAGGFSENAKKNSVYVVYQNGNVASTKSFLIFNNYPKLKPGSKIIVPEKNIVKNKTSVGEIVGYTTSLVSIIALIKSL